MKSSFVLKLAVSSLALGVTMVGCKPAGYGLASVSSKAVKSEAKAGQFAERARSAAQKGQFAEGVTLAEQAVDASPRDAGYRLLLADLYLKSGRFASAESAFGDVLTLDPANQRAGLSRVLALIALGRTGQAVFALDELTATAPPADVGLAFALAGQPDRAIEILEPAARGPEANGRVRQNLALAYAISGDWKKARIVAEQDLSPAELEDRMRQWAGLSNPSAPHTQVASLLGVEAVQDQGQPTHLALVTELRVPTALPAAVGGPEPTAEPVKVAAIDALPAIVPVVQSPAPVAEPVAPAAAEAPAIETFHAPVQPATIDVPVIANPERTRPIAQATFAAAVQSLVEAPEPVIKKTPRLVRASAAFKAEKKLAPQTAKRGKFVVQIGAFRTSQQLERAWASAHRRYGFGTAEPLSTTVAVTGKGTFHRLAVAGFDSSADAAKLCQSIRAKGGSCFVRSNAGDAPVQWAWRYTGRKTRQG